MDAVASFHIHVSDVPQAVKRRAFPKKTTRGLAPGRGNAAGVASPALPQKCKVSEQENARTSKQQRVTSVADEDRLIALSVGKSVGNVPRRQLSARPGDVRLLTDSGITSMSGNVTPPLLDHASDDGDRHCEDPRPVHQQLRSSLGERAPSSSSSSCSTKVIPVIDLSSDEEDAVSGVGLSHRGSRASTTSNVGTQVATEPSVSKNASLLGGTVGCFGERRAVVSSQCNGAPALLYAPPSVSWNSWQVIVSVEA